MMHQHLHSAPDPPQWRFVRKAKKTEGYSSDYAGSYVRGLSAEELVGKHTPSGRVSQQINHIEQSIDNSTNKDLEEDSSDVEKNIQSVGRLIIVESGNERDTNKNDKDIGKLRIEGEHTYEESYGGSFAFPKSKEEIDIQSDKEVVVGTTANEDITEDTKTDNDTTIIEDTKTDNNATTDVATVDVVSYTADDDLDRVENQTNMSNGLTSAPVVSQSREEERTKPNTRRRRSLRVVCFLVILLSVIAAVALGIVFGSSSDKNVIGEQVSNLSGVGGGDNQVPSLMPSIQPSGNDSKVIPLSTKQPSSIPTTSRPSLGPTSLGPSFSRAPSNEPSSQPSLQPSSLPSSQPSSQPTLTAIPSSTHKPTTTTSPIEPSFTPSQQPSTSTNPTRPTTQSPTFLVRKLVFPSDNLAIPCLESIEAEMAGRLYGINGNFCGLCQWKRSSFNCYQRVSFLYRHYKVPQLTARQNLLNRDQCTVPDEGIGAGIQAMIDRQSYCGDVDTVGVTTSVETTVTISEPI